MGSDDYAPPVKKKMKSGVARIALHGRARTTTRCASRRFSFVRAPARAVAVRVHTQLARAQGKKRPVSIQETRYRETQTCTSIVRKPQKNRYLLRRLQGIYMYCEVHTQTSQDSCNNNNNNNNEKLGNST